MQMEEGGGGRAHVYAIVACIHAVRFFLSLLADCVSKHVTAMTDGIRVYLVV